MQPTGDSYRLIGLIGDQATPSHKWMAMNVSARLGAILSNISLVLLFFGIAMALAILLSTVMTVLFMVFLAIVVILAIIFTLGLILLAAPEEWNQLTDIQNTMVDITAWLVEFSNKSAPYVLILAVITAGLSIVFLALDRTKRHTARLICSSVIVAVGLVAAVIAFL